MPSALSLCAGVAAALVWSAGAQCGPNGDMPIPQGMSECPSGPPDGADGNGGGPPGGGASFGTAASGCSVADDSVCEQDGSNSYVDVSGLSYADGKFTGTLKANQCPKGSHYLPNGDLTSVCTETTFPASGYETGPKAAPLRGPVGVTWSMNNVYGPFEAGFGAGTPAEACDVEGVSSCPAGLDVPKCEGKIRKECLAGQGNVKAFMMLDDCGGHAMPYHYHVPMRCEYSQSSAAEHSPIIGLALDGHGIYGVWEGGSFPALDACNGHTGFVPANSTHGIPREEVYHYHVTPYNPFTIGCFGPVDSVDECKSLYSTCEGETVSFDAQHPNGTNYRVTDYDLDCPCVQHYTACEHASLSDIDDAYQTLVPGFSYPAFNGQDVVPCTPGAPGPTTTADAAAGWGHVVVSVGLAVSVGFVRS